MVSDDDKIALPDTQDSQQVNDNQCTICSRSFSSHRGLQLHLRSCREKEARRQEEVLENGSQADSISEAVEEVVQTSDEPPVNQNLDQNQAVWGGHTYADLESLVTEMYNEIVFWRKNLFKLPSGAAGKNFIREVIKLIDIWNENKQPMCELVLKMIMIMPGLLLQKPSRKSTAKQHTEYLQKRLGLWIAGNFEELLREGRAIQQKLKQQKRTDETNEHVAKNFAKLMLQGKVHAALRILDKAASLGIAELTEETLKALSDLHPAAQEARDIALLEGEIPYFDPILFTNIDEQSIAKAALRTRGAAGPSGLDAEGWRRILVSKNYGTTGKDLRTALAKMTQNLCTRQIPVTERPSNSLEAYTANRLIPLLKAPTGIRPIGIGEVLRRIIGKAVINEIKPEIMESAGSLQLCAGQRAGCEAAAHAMGEIFEEEDTDAVLFIDASNAFNTLNRTALLHNIHYLCPPMATYINNCYQKPSRLFIAGGKELMSSEGTTQGDPSAMPSYGIGILPYLAMIRPDQETGFLKQLAYTDDIGGGAKLTTLRVWWDKIERYGPSFGYFPKASKSWLVVKEEKHDEALEIFAGTGIKVTTEGRKYLGGFVGTKQGAEDYVQELRDEWIEQLEVLTDIAKSEPQAAYAGFTAGFQHKMTYFIRTIPDLAEILKPLDDFINDKFIPAITEGHVLSAADRKLLSLPVRYGGLGIPIYQEICANEFENSRKATQILTPKIVAQERDFESDPVREREIEREIKNGREQAHKEKLQALRANMSKEQLRANDLAQLKGASAWLTSLPLKEEGFVLNKREFFDAISLRYRWDLKRLPLKCICNHAFTADHAMQCMRGGYVTRRHDRIRDLFAKLLDDVATGVHIEPALQPLTGENLPKSANKGEEARVDIAAKGFWQQYEMAFFDIRVFSPFAKSYMNNNLDAAFRTNEAGKKREYNQRVIQIEHGSFTPVVVSAFGGFGKESERFVARLVQKISEKKHLEASVVANYVRRKVSFELVKSQVDCIRGSRNLWKRPVIDTGEIELVDGAANIMGR